MRPRARLPTIPSITHSLHPHHLPLPASTNQPRSHHPFTTPFSTYTISHQKSLPPRPTLPDADIKHAYLKGSGPGGQKINKTSSAVQLTHLPTGIVVKSQATRSRSQNHTIARRILAEKIELIEKGAESRAARIVERKSKRKRSGEKKRRRKYRALEEGREKPDGVGGGSGVGLMAAGAAAISAGSRLEGGVEMGDDLVRFDEDEEWEDGEEEENDCIPDEEHDVAEDLAKDHAGIQ